jgi:hypothetical protein
MNKTIYIATSEHNSGKSSNRFNDILIGKTAKVSYFSSSIEDFEDGKVDNP